MEQKTKFPTQAYGDGIIIRRIEILNKIQKSAKKSKLVIADGKAPTNILDIERQKAKELSTYDDAEHKLLEMWDEHPHQGIVMSVGTGRNLGNGMKLIPEVKVGTHILYRANSGEPMIINKHLYWLIHDNDIYSVVPAADLIK
jgi:co-chaperonin GroES (HSP10)